MIYSDILKFWFIHNPKVAGSSIRRALIPFNTSDFELWHQKFIPGLDRIVDVSHVTAFDTPFVLGKPLPEDFFKFGFVRNPYERFFSAIKEHARQNNLALANRSQISDFVVRKLNPTSVRYDWNLSHFCPQHYFFYSGKKIQADFIGRYSHLNEDLRKVCSILGIEPVELGHERNTGTKPPDLSLLDREALLIVNQLYAWDWLIFAPFLTESPPDLPVGRHHDNVFNVRHPAGKTTFYGEPPGLSLGEKVGFLTERVQTLEKSVIK